MTAFAIAGGHRVTCEAAEDALRAGGTAVDAVIAGALAAMVAEPVLAGLLGGGFLMVRDPGGRAHLLDFFVQTPLQRRSISDLDFRAIQADFGNATQEFHVGAGAIAVPGVAPGLAEAHARFGRVPMPVLAEPACTAARSGVTISEYQAKLGEIVGAILKDSPESRSLFCSEGEPLPAGAVWKNPALADVLEVYAQEGPRFVTEGEIAQSLLELAGNDGHLQAEDLRTYRPEWRTPLTFDRSGARIWLNPPPSLGGSLIAFALQILPREPSTLALTAVLEATARARIEAAIDDGDTARLFSPDLLQRYRREVAGQVSTRGTTHISVIDGEGMGAALTLSNGEGCGLIAPGTGIMPNNMLGEEDLMPRGFDDWNPGQRLASMMAPMAVAWPDGRIAMLGSGGSNRIRTALAQVLVHILDRGARLADAIEEPRVHAETGDPPAIDFEDLAGEETREILLGAWPEARAWPDRSMFFGGVHGAMRDARGGLDAAGDPRRAGVARIG